MLGDHNVRDMIDSSTNTFRVSIFNGSQDSVHLKREILDLDRDPSQITYSMGVKEQFFLQVVQLPFVARNFFLLNLIYFVSLNLNIGRQLNQRND